MAENLDYGRATDRERVHGIFVGDPVGNYYGFPEVQEQILANERAKALGETAICEIAKPMDEVA